MLQINIPSEKNSILQKNIIDPFYKQNYQILLIIIELLVSLGLTDWAHCCNGITKVT